VHCPHLVYELHSKTRYLKKDRSEGKTRKVT